MKVVTTNLLNRFWKNGIKPIKEALTGKIDSSRIVNSLLATEAGFALDARQGKVLDEKITELNGNMSPSNETLANGVWIERCGQHRVLHLTNATAVSGLVVTLDSADCPVKSLHGAAAINKSQTPNLYVAVGTDGKVQLFNAGSLQGVTSALIATIDWYVY